MSGCAPGELGGLLALANSGRTGAAGLVWFLVRGGGTGLTVGVRGDVGALDWFGVEGTELPVGGLNPVGRDYFTVTGTHNAMPAGSELPFDLVVEVVEEFVATGERPTRVRWRAEVG
ncbi:Immunity protein Imm1 [Actinosynnema pretiosum]|nr:Immunity protein Imm1 [Actinosynnema pretiosum]